MVLAGPPSNWGRSQEIASAGESRLKRKANRQSCVGPAIDLLDGHADSLGELRSGEVGRPASSEAGQVTAPIKRLFSQRTRIENLRRQGIEGTASTLRGCPP